MHPLLNATERRTAAAAARNHPPRGELGRGCGRERGPGATSGSPTPSKRASGLNSAPSELLAFIAGRSERDAARELGLSKGSVGRLRAGYWPADPRKVLAAWQRHQGDRAARASAWFLRRVYPGGVVRHAGRHYTAAGLGARTGQLLAVARAGGDGLLAQALEQPVERLVLSAIPTTAD